MKYNFDPTQYGFLPPGKTPKCLKTCLHKKSFIKVICVSENGKERLKADSLRIPRRKRRIV